MGNQYAGLPSQQLDWLSDTDNSATYPPNHAPGTFKRQGAELVGPPCQENNL